MKIKNVETFAHITKQSDIQSKLKYQRNIALSGDVSGSQDFDGSQDVVIDQVVQDNSHNHLWGDITDKPATFPPSTHDHDDLYYTKSETDQDFVNVSGDTMTGDLNFNISLAGIKWAMNTDYQSIKFKNTSDGDTDSYLQFDVGDNGNEYFKWTSTQSSTTNDLMKLRPSSGNLELKGDISRITGTGTITGYNLSGNASTQTMLELSKYVNEWETDTSIYEQGTILYIKDLNEVIFSDGFTPANELLEIKKAHLHNDLPASVKDYWGYKGAFSPDKKYLMGRINGTKPEGYDATTAESYGLVHGTDLVATVRKDDVPFQGVSSFAVEEETENLLNGVANPYSEHIFTGTAMGRYTHIDFMTDGGLFNSAITRGTRTPESNEGYVALTKGFTFTASTGDTFTYSVYVRKYGNSTSQLKLMYYDGSNAYAAYTVNLTSEWQRASFTFTLNKDITTLSLYNLVNKNDFAVGEGFEICMPQFEKKPFATSFVDGTSDDGQLKINQFWSYKNVVFAAHFKINKINNPYPRIFDQTGDSTNATQPITFTFYYDNTTHNFSINNHALSSPIINPEGKWMFVVIGFDENVGFIKLYDENSLVWDTTFPNEIDENTIKQYTFKIGDSGTKQRLLNGLISNLYIGEYDPNIWTDEFIARLANSKNTMSI